MACIKGVNRSASVAISPESPYMAAGTMAGAVDMSFSSSANLEIFKLDFQSDDFALPVVGETQSSERFNRLSWSRPVPDSEQYSLGLIAGGLVDGHIDIWNPLALINPEISESALVGHFLKHQGPVRGLEFNAIAPNYLASGADDGEICIWDLTAPSEPSYYPPLRGNGSAAQGEISYLSWNSKVQHILASTSYSGTTVVWDLKKQKPVISFTDPIRRRCSVLQWNPDMATQLFVASDDDNHPVLRLWDMRNTLSPVKELPGHTKGVIAMSWCPSDSRYLLTCAKDNRTICWDTLSGEIVCELPTGANWNFDIHWYPKIPGVISASSFDGNIGMYNIEGCSRYGVGENDLSAAPITAPKWYKRPGGASFCFGGKLVSFHPRSSGDSVKSSEVFVHSLVTEDSLVSRSSEFEAAIQNGERSSLRVLCEQKAQQSESVDDRETWGFLKVMFEDDGGDRTKLLTHLGFSVPTEAKDDREEELSQELNALAIENTEVDNVGLASDKETAVFAFDNGEDFFNNLPSPKAETPLSISGDNFVAEGTVPCEEEMQHEMDEHEEQADSSFDDALQRALMVGDYKSAVEQCVTANKIADALVIAHVGGTPLWESTRDQYLKMSNSPYLKVVSAMVNNDLMSLVHTRPLKSWKETLALLCSFAQTEEWTLLCDTLASKLMSDGNTRAATFCYICAGNIDKTVEIWSRSLTSDHQGKPYIDLLQDLMEKTIVLALATGQKRFSASLCKLVEKYAEILASQGLLTTAMEYLKLLGSDELSPELQILRDRIALCTETEKEVSNISEYENSQLHNGPVYGANQPSFSTVQTSQNHYQETMSQVHQSVPSSSYAENYQQPFTSYGNGGYDAPAPYQPTSQPNIFLPSQAPQGPSANFGPPPGSTQPMARPFVPATPTILRNVEQYQQPTLGSQLYPGINPTYQPGDGAGDGSLGPVRSQGGSRPMMRNVVGPTPTPRGFMPVNTGDVQRPEFSSMQPPSPTQQAVQPAVVHSEPPPTVQTVDTSNVPAHQRPVITTLTRLFHETSEAVEGSMANASKKREIEDNSKKIGALFAKLNSGNISKNAADNLVMICQALDNRDFGKALHIQVQLTTSDWDECNYWLVPLKRMIKARQNIR